MRSACLTRFRRQDSVIKPRKMDAPTRLLTWAVRAWKGREKMADDKHAKTKDNPGSVVLSSHAQALYFKMRTGEKIELTPADKTLLCAALERLYPVLARQARIADRPTVWARMEDAANKLFWGVMIGAGVALVIMAIWK